MADRFATFHETEKEGMRASLVASIDETARLDGALFDRTIAMTEAAAEKVLEDWADLDAFIRSTLVHAALAALARNGSVDDLPIARQYLHSRDSAHAEAALELVSRFGNDADIEPLLALATREYGDIAEQAAETALALSEDCWMQAKQYVERETEPFVRVGIEALAAHSEFPSRWPELVPYLLVSDANVRRATAKLLGSRLDDVELMELVSQCHKAATYYYDVITILDRAVYGPAAWRSV